MSLEGLTTACWSVRVSPPDALVCAGAAKSSPAKAPAKGKGAKGKAAPAAGQRGIQSFFGKKG